MISIGGQWKEYKQTALQRQSQLAEIRAQFGYGGFIHNFKNHVLRGGQKFVDRFEENRERMDQAFANYAGCGESLHSGHGDFVENAPGG